jgi:hypothetical protein
VIEGAPVETIRTLKKELVAMHGETVPIVDKNGDTIEFDAKYYAEMVARTKTRGGDDGAARALAGERLRPGRDHRPPQRRTSAPAFLGQVFSLSGKSDKYPALLTLPRAAYPAAVPSALLQEHAPVRRLPGQREAAAQAETLPDAEKLLGMDTSKAQRAFKDLQIHQQIGSLQDDGEGSCFGSAV